jgi:asparagine synthase (glutamine-hydrolysing)
MSGIFGFFNRDGRPAEKAIAETMLEAVSYWGPDERAALTSGPAALGHAMLWNTPESKHEHLPLQEGSCILTMEARIDNRETLATALDLPDRPLDEIGDSEFLLAAYRKWGEACPKHLLGDFVFAIWDGDKKQFFCARDHVGVKPFYYFANDDLFVFTNLLRPIVTHPDVPKNLNEESLARYLRPEGFHDERATFFKAVKKLPPATTLVVSEKKITESVYWDLGKIAPIRYENRQAYLAHFRKLFDEAVEARLRTLYPVASHLSGGLDSSSVAVLAARKLKKRSKPLYAYHWAQERGDESEDEQSEWRYAEQIADTEGIHYERIRLTPEALCDIYDTADLLNNDIGYFWEEYLIRDTVRRQNARTILSGWGGDQFASYDGYAYYSGLFWKGHFLTAIRKIYEAYAHRSHPILRTVRRSVRELIYPLFYKRMHGYYKKMTFDVDPFFYCKEGFARFARTLPAVGPAFVPGAHGEQRYLLKEGAIQKRMEQWFPAALAQRMEYVYPLLDKRIIEFALAIPEELYDTVKGVKRVFFRETIEDLLAHDIVWTTKGDAFHPDPKRIQLYESSFRLWLEKNARQNSDDSEFIDEDKLVSNLESYFAAVPEERPELSTVIESIILFHAKSK